MEMSPVFEAEAAGHSIVTFPIGSDVISIAGAPPTRQRLLSGNVAYYWKHGMTARTITIKFKLPQFTRHQLELEQLNP